MKFQDFSLFFVSQKTFSENVNRFYCSCKHCLWLFRIKTCSIVLETSNRTGQKLSLRNSKEKHLLKFLQNDSSLRCLQRIRTNFNRFSCSSNFIVTKIFCTYRFSGDSFEFWLISKVFLTFGLVNQSIHFKYFQDTVLGNFESVNLSFKQQTFLITFQYKSFCIMLKSSKFVVCRFWNSPKTFLITFAHLTQFWKQQILFKRLSSKVLQKCWSFFLLVKPFKKAKLYRFSKNLFHRKITL